MRAQSLLALIIAACTLADGLRIVPALTALVVGNGHSRDAAAPGSNKDSEAAVGKKPEARKEPVQAPESHETEHERKESIESATRLLFARGWKESAAMAAASAAAGNFTAAEELLQGEEQIIATSFQKSLAALLEQGWDEMVARQALLSQYTIHRRQAAGEYVQISRSVLDTIQPSLRRSTNASAPLAEMAPQSSNLKNTATAAAAAASASATTTTAKPAPSPSLPPQPQPAKREDVVLDVTEATLQSLLESDVPVLLDVHAEWCGPCKHLGPMLEQAAIRAGGLFKLAKIDGDKERGLAEALEVNAFPTVFALVKGRVTDRFRGLQPPEKIQSFLLRAITGSGSRIQTDFTEADTSRWTEQISQLAGLAALSAAKKKAIFSLVDSAMADPATFATTKAGRQVLATGPSKAMAYIRNARDDIHNTTVRTISCESSVFSTQIENSPAAKLLLEAAGFHKADGAVLRLTHANAAHLSLVVQRVDAALDDKRFAKMRASAAFGAGSSSPRKQPPSPSPTPSTSKRSSPPGNTQKRDH